MHILENPVDSWAQAMKKLAGDVIHRIFEALSVEDSAKILDQHEMINCFLVGQSDSKWLKGIGKRKIGLGQEIKAIFNGAEKGFFTAKIFEKSCCLWKDKNGKYFSKEPVAKSDKYLFRHAYDFETSDCKKSVDFDNPKLQQFLKVDRYEMLMAIKDEVIKELFYKFMSQDKKVISVMKDVLENHFLNMDEKLEKIERGHGVIIQNTNELLENQNIMLEKMRQMEIRLAVPQNNIVTIAVGNPGIGKSTLLNSLAGQLFFQSGISLGKGLTSCLGVGKNGQGVFLDTPGMADESLRKIASKAICEGFKRGGHYRVLFFVTERNGRVLAQDTTTMKLVLDACPDIGTQYGIIVNKLSKKFLKNLNLKSNFHDFLNILFSGISEHRQCSYEKVLFLGNVDELEDEDNVLIPSDAIESYNGVTLTNFVNDVVPTVCIKKENVSDIQDEDFEKMTSEIEAISKSIMEKDETWKKERCFYEEQRMKEEIENQRKLRELQEEILRRKEKMEV